MSEVPDNIERYRLAGTSVPSSSHIKIDTKSATWFLKGPIPGDWLNAASALPGRSLHVGLVIWFKHGLTKMRQFNITRKDRERFNIPDDAYRRGIIHLEKSGLILVKRRKGRPSLISILRD